MRLSNLKAAVIAAAFIALVSFHGAQQQPQKINLTLTVEQTELALEGLSKLPYEKSAPVIEAIRLQAIPQLYPPAKADSTKPKKN